MSGEVGRPRKINKMESSLTVRFEPRDLEKFQKLCDTAERKPADIIREFVRGKVIENHPQLISRFKADDAVQPTVGAITYKYNPESNKIESHGVTEEGKDILLEIHEVEHVEEDISHMYEAYQDYLKKAKPKERRAPRKVYRI
ncbi:hypothetical protein ACFLRC_04720 [Candidatus Altiarchaeota archaeon]